MISGVLTLADRQVFAAEAVGNRKNLASAELTEESCSHVHDFTAAASSVTDSVSTGQLI